MLSTALLRLSLLATLGTAIPTAVSVRQEQLFKLVVRVIKQPTQHAAFKIEGYYVTSADFVSNARELILIPKSGNTTQQGEHVVPENYYTNTSAFTVRQSLTAADAARPYGFDLFPWAASPVAYCSVLLNNDYSWNGSEVYSVAANQPYFGINDPPNNYNVPDPKEGHFLACEIDEGIGPRIQFYVNTGITDPNANQTDCAQIRLLPECAGNFTSGSAPKNVVLSSCYSNARTAPLPKLAN